MSKQKKGPAFLLKTFDMLQQKKEEFKEIIDWISDGTGFVVKNPTELAEKVLPKYFKHSNTHSFIRQLNMYGFNKKRGSKVQNYYSHPQFLRGQRQMILEMQRKAQKKGSHKDNTRDALNQEVSIEVQENSQQENKQNQNQNCHVLSQNRRMQKQIEEENIRKNVIELATYNKIFLMEQIYHLANIQTNNLLSYHLNQQIDSQNMVNTDNSVLQRFQKVKDKYLKIQALIWDKINSMVETFGAEAQKKNAVSEKQLKATSIQIPKQYLEKQNQGSINNQSVKQPEKNSNQPSSQKDMQIQNSHKENS